MCGILGTITKNKDHIAYFSKALQTLSHRGPDSEGVKKFIVKEKTLILGQKRLAIIDLNPEANQPMSDHTGQFWIIFNGEIYNYLELKNTLKKKGHTFKTASDTEVILEGYKAYGIKVVDMLLGMFAFALFDGKEKSLILARDHFGKKPLYYYFSEHELLFGSELKGLLAFPDLKEKVTIDDQSIRKFLMYGYIPSPKSIYKEINKLSPATAIQIDLANLKIIKTYRFWHMNSVSLKDVSFDEARNNTEALLREAVRKRLIADVPVGSFLSGGIDSSLVTAIASEYHPGIETFSVIYDDKKFDESKYVKLVGDKLSIKYNFFNFKDSLALPLLHEVLAFMDEPMADASLLPTTYIAKQTRKKVTVALSGDGGDELFGGYPKYNAQKFLDNQLILFLLKAGRKAENVIDTLPISPVRKNIYKKLLHGVSLKDYSRHFIWGSGSFTFSELASLVKNSIEISEDEVFSESKKLANEFRQHDFGNKLLFLDAMIQLPDWYLVKADRASMSQSLEVRSPFLDKELAEYVFSLPSKYKFTMKKNKILLKVIAGKYLPGDVIHRRKMGFGLPLNTWLANNFKADVEKSLASLPDALFNKEYISTMWSEFMHNKADHGTKIWRLFILGTFLQKYGKNI